MGTFYFCEQAGRPCARRRHHPGAGSKPQLLSNLPRRRPSLGLCASARAIDHSPKIWVVHKRPRLEIGLVNLHDREGAACLVPNQDRLLLGHVHEFVTRSRKRESHAWECSGGGFFLMAKFQAEAGDLLVFGGSQKGFAFGAAGE